MRSLSLVVAEPRRASSSAPLADEEPARWRRSQIMAAVNDASMPGASVFLAAAIGVLLAAVIAAWFFPIAISDKSFTHLLPSQFPQITPKPREKSALALAALLGTIGAMIGARLSARRLPMSLMCLGSLGLVCALNAAFAYALREESSAPVVTLVFLGLLAVAIWILRPLPQPLPAADEPRTRPPLTHWTWDGLTALLFIAVLMPSSFEAVAAKVGYEMHVVSFLIGPALYRFGTNLVPGVDYFTQYSVGLPYLFSFALPETAAATMVRYAVLMVTSMYVYYLAAYLGLVHLLRSRAWALGITLTALLLNFHTDRPFFDPSSYVLRHPLLVVTIPLLAWWVAGRLSWRRGLALAASLAASVFLNTETGVLQVAVVALVAVFAGRTLFRGGIAAAAVTTATVSLFAAMCAFAFGPRALSVDFFRYLFEPFAIYGGGYGGWPIAWTWDWGIFYNIVAPGLALGTLGWALVQLRISRLDSQQSYLAALAAIAGVSITLSMKYWNMSIVGLWHVNAFGFLIIAGWWCRTRLERFHHLSSRPSWLPVRQGGAAVAGLFAASMLIFAGDARNPSLYGLHAWGVYPSELARLAGFASGGCRDMSCVDAPPAAQDIELIQKYVGPGEQAAIVDWNDWRYLIEARRAPKFAFIPSAGTFTWRQLDQSLDGLTSVFMTVGTNDQIVIENQELGEELGALLSSDFVPAARGARYELFTRKTNCC